MTLAFAVAALASAPGRASAQSATIFGVLDVNLRSVTNGSAGRLRSESTDGLNTSRLGFSGLEDLGDGLKASFWLEAQLSPDTGSIGDGTRTFNRRSTVSIIDPTFGEVRLGRDKMPTYTAIETYDAFGTNGLGEVIGNGTGTGIVSGLGSGANTIKRADNQVSYLLPASLGGAYGQFALAPGEGTAGNKQVSGRFGYATGPFNVSLSYAQTTVKADDKFKQTVIGGFYDFGVVKAMVQFIQTKYASVAGGPRRQNVYEIGAIVPVGSSEFHVGYVNGKMSGGAPLSGFADGDDANQVAATYLYKLSKRTALYGTVAHLSNKGASKLILAAGAPGMQGGQSSNGYEAGIRHSF
jgi:predicted porin